VKKSKLFSILALWLPLTASSQSSGYLGKKHELSVDLADAVLQRSISVDYKLAFHKNFGLLLNIAPQSLETDIEGYNADYEPAVIGTATVSSLSYGGGLLMKTPWTGMPLPLGHYFAALFTVNTASVTEKTIHAEQPEKYKISGYTARLVMARESRIYKGLVIDYGISLGYAWGTVSGDSLFYPDRLYPYTNILAHTSGEFDNTPDPKVLQYSRVHFMPRLRIGWIF
jgi:hypothetical protein